MQLLYLDTILSHSFCGSSVLEKSMHSSRAAFSSLHTQQGYEGGGGVCQSVLLCWERCVAPLKGQ